MRDLIEIPEEIRPLPNWAYCPWCKHGEEYDILTNMPVQCNCGKPLIIACSSCKTPVSENKQASNKCSSAKCKSDLLEETKTNIVEILSHLMIAENQGESEDLNSEWDIYSRWAVPIFREQTSSSEYSEVLQVCQVGNLVVEATKNAKIPLLRRAENL